MHKPIFALFLTARGRGIENCRVHNFFQIRLYVADIFKHSNACLLVPPAYYSLSFYFLHGL